MLPKKHTGILTTPHELQYHEKVDYRLLFPLFSTAYIKQYTSGGQKINKWRNNTLKCIVVGQCPNSDSLLFYHPGSKHLVSLATYKFNTYLPSGPQFNEKYDGTFVMNTMKDHETLHIMPTHQLHNKVYIKTSDNTYVLAWILAIPMDESNEPYVVQETDTGNIMEVLSTKVLEYDPNQQFDKPGINIQFPHILWICNNAKVTMIPSQAMTQPKQGYLKFQDDGWYFLPGQNKSKKPILLPDFIQLAQSMIQNRKLFEGWKTKNSVLNARQLAATSNLFSHAIYCRKVSAKGLIDMHAPTSLLQHQSMHPKDKQIWDDSYKSEYNGLLDIDTFEIISEDEYQNLKHTVRGVMPCIAITVIKYDGEGRLI